MFALLVQCARLGENVRTGDTPSIARATTSPSAQAVHGRRVDPVHPGVDAARIAAMDRYRPAVPTRTPARAAMATSDSERGDVQSLVPNCLVCMFGLNSNSERIYACLSSCLPYCSSFYFRARAIDF